MRHLLALAVLLAAGCCTPSGQTPIFAETTLARLELPERPTKIVRLSVGGAESTWYVLSRDHLADAPAVERSEVTENYPGDPCDEESLGLFGRVDVCLAKRLSFGYSRREKGPPMGHATLYLAGPERERARAGDFSLALTGAWGQDDAGETTEQSNGDTYRSHWNRKQRDLGLVAGVRTGRSVLLYGGPYRLRTNFSIDHERPDAAPQSSGGTITATGWHIGISLFAGRNHSWLLEYSRASVDAGNDDSISNTGFKYQLEFGGKSPAPRRKPAPQPS